MTSGRHSAGLALITAGLLIFIALSEAGGTISKARFIRSAAETGGKGASGAAEGALPLGVFPALVEEGSLEVRKAYAFASDADNHALMQSLDCYCGCAAGLKHESLFHCFVEQLLPGDLAIYSEHGAGCFTCQSEALDAAEWKRQGRSVPEIKELVDGKYGD